MKIVIDIPNEIYQKIKETNMVISGRRSGRSIDYILFNAVINGTQLPKSHGRLIDADELEECKEIMDTVSGESKYAVRMDDIRNMPTIIPTESEEEE